MDDDRKALVMLRISLARVAQVAGLDVHIPGKVGDDAPYEALHEAAKTQERGWHALAACVAEWVQEHKRD